MRRHWILVSLGLALSLSAAAQRPTPDEQRHTLDTARDIAVHYASKLPDFLCTEQVERTDAVIPLSRPKVDRLVIQLSYFGQKEKYKLVTMNGSPATQPLESLDGLITGGEFGSLLTGVFDSSSKADFEWKENSNLHKRRVAVYAYKIPRAGSHYMLGHRNANGSMNPVAAGYHGEVYLDTGTSHVLKLTASADDIPKETGILQSSVEVDYDFVTVAGKSYLLPSHSDSKMERDHRQIGNIVKFTDYKKFEADSTIDFKE